MAAAVLLVTLSELCAGTLISQFFCEILVWAGGVGLQLQRDCQITMKEAYITAKAIGKGTRDITCIEQGRYAWSTHRTPQAPLSTPTLDRPRPSNAIEKGQLPHLRYAFALVVPLLPNSHNVTAQVLSEQVNGCAAGHFAVHNLHACSACTLHTTQYSVGQQDISSACASNRD